MKSARWGEFSRRRVLTPKLKSDEAGGDVVCVDSLVSAVTPSNVALEKHPSAAKAALILLSLQHGLKGVPFQNIIYAVQGR